MDGCCSSVKGAVAQRLEQATHNRLVGGSSPSSPIWYNIGGVLKMDIAKEEVLDLGFVRLLNVMGDDTSVANAARVSYAKHVDQMTDKEEKLIRYLAKNEHTSPFRHAFMSFEIYAPLMVARQWWKYVVGSDHVMDGWNEESRRYLNNEPEFYIPDGSSWRKAPKNSKQGSSEPLHAEIGDKITFALARVQDDGLRAYRYALEEGVAPELARLFLPANAQYTNWVWSGSLQSVAHFIVQRSKSEAQYEIREYAKAVYKLIKFAFPVSLAALLNDTGE